MLGLFFVLAAGAATTTIPTTDDPDRPQIRVPYRDLNLNSVEGTKRLEMRVRQAVAELCGNSGGGGYLETAREIGRCRTVAMASAHHEAELAINKAGAPNAAVTASGVAIVASK